MSRTLLTQPDATIASIALLGASRSAIYKQTPPVYPSSSSSSGRRCRGSHPGPGRAAGSYRHVDAEVPVDERRQPDHVLLPDRLALDAELANGGDQVDGGPQNDAVQDESEDAKLVLGPR
jgi:hypothetical protein